MPLYIPMGVTKGLLNMSYVSTHDQLVNSLTKAL